MINFYQTWKDDKESEPKKKRKRGSHQCVLCGSYVNGLKDHMDSVHGKGTYEKFVSAEEQIKERRRQEIIEVMRNIK